MSRKYGGGGVKCKICGKTVYAGEKITFEKETYHVNCFRCTTCNQKMGPDKAILYEGKLYDRRCYQRNGFAQKQKKVVWTKSTTTSTTTSSSGSKKFGGGGVKCTICGKTVYPAEKTVFEKKIYHNGCFKCSKCKKKITTSDCLSDPDSGDLFCRKCAKTSGVTAKQLNSTKTWKSTGGGGSSKFGGGGTKCALCGKTVYMGEQVVYEKKVYHPKCLKCTTCSKILQPAQTDSFDGKNYCHKCFATGGFAQKQSKVKWKKGQNAGGGSGKYGGGGIKCYKCGKTVYQGEKVTFEKRTYHIKCFKCDICSKKMTTSTANHFSLETNDHAKKLGIEFEEKNGKRDLAICRKCFGEKNIRSLQASQKKWVGKTSSSTTDKRFNAFGGGGTKCKVCSKTVYPAEALNFEKHTWHAKCFCCQECGKKLTLSSVDYTKHDDGDIDIYCKQCFFDKGLNRANIKKTKAGHHDEEQTETETKETTEETTQENNEEPVRDTLD